MKKIVYVIMIIAAAVLCSCKKEKQGDGVGTLQMKVSASGDYVTKASTNSDIKEFVITITRPADGWQRVYPRYADMPLNVELGSGAYTVTASSLYTEDAAWDQPIYRGSADFTIAAGEMTPVSLVCTLANMKVTVVPTQDFLNQVSSFEVTVTNAASWTAAVEGVNTLVWNAEKIENGDAGYFTVAPLSIKVDGFRSIDNSEASAGLTISNVAARDHHVIHLDARVVGEATFTLVIDDEVVQKDDNVFVDGWDETPVDGGDPSGDDPDDPNTPDDPPVVDPNLPTATWATNPDFAPILMQSNMTGMVEIEFNVPGKIVTFGVDVDSDVLSETLAALSSTPDYEYQPGHPFWMDMIYDDTLCENLGGMGLGIPLKDDLLGQTHVTFSLSGLIPLALMYQPTPGSYHYFNLKLTDEEGRQLEKMITFIAPAQ